MASQITNYQCPACSGPMHFDADSGKLKCDYCGSMYEIAEVEALFAKKEAEAAAAYAKEQAKHTPAQPTDATTTTDTPNDVTTTSDAGGAGGVAGGDAGGVAGAAATTGDPATADTSTVGGEWSTSHLSTDWGEDEQNMRAYSCPSCAAEVICDATTAATSCLYCGNPTVVPGQFAGVLRPDYVIPFKKDKEDAIAALKNHYKGKYLLPKCFSKENHLEEIKGVYVPVWLFDGEADADINFDASNSETHTSGDYRVTTTHHYKVRRAGKVNFEKIPVDASSKMPDEHMESIEPYDYSELKPFSTAYMPGYLADKYDVSAEDSSKRADERAVDSTIAVMQNSVTGYDKRSISTKYVNITRGEIEYAMTPVWLLSTRYKNKPYLFAMNGQTGSFVGDLPVDWGKFWLTAGGITAGLTALLSLIWFVFL